MYRGDRSLQQDQFPILTLQDSRDSVMTRMIKAFGDTPVRMLQTDLTPDDDGNVNTNVGVTRNMPVEYRHQYVLSALQNDPKSTLIYEHDNALNGQPKLSVTALANLLNLSPGAVSQRRNKISEIVNNAERDIYG